MSSNSVNQNKGWVIAFAGNSVTLNNDDQPFIFSSLDEAQTDLKIDAADGLDVDEFEPIEVVKAANGDWIDAYDTNWSDAARRQA